MATDVNMGEELADNQGGECLFEAVPDNSDQAGQVMMEGAMAWRGGTSNGHSMVFKDMTCRRCCRNTRNIYER